MLEWRNPSLSLSRALSARRFACLHCLVVPVHRVSGSL